MIVVSDLSMTFDKQTLFKHVDLKFTPGNCYGIIGANGAGKSTFLRILEGQLEPSSGTVSMAKNMRMSVLRQDHFAFDEYPVLDTVIMGNKRLYEVWKEKDALYAKEDFTDEDGIRAAELEGEYAEMGGWESESDASRLVQGLGLPESILYEQMSAITDSETCETLFSTLTENASYESSGTVSAKQSLLIQLDSGLTLQLAVKNDKLSACGTWSCPEFLEAFEAALQ